MKRFVAMMIAGAFALSLAGAAVSEDKKPAAPPAKEAGAKKEAAPKPEAAKGAKSRVITGLVESVDAAAGTVTVKGRKEAVTLKAAAGVNLADVKAGDKVTVTFKGDALSKIVKPKSGQDCKNCPTDNNCKDCPKAAKGGKSGKGAKAGKADKACAECPKAEAAPRK